MLLRHLLYQKKGRFCVTIMQSKNQNNKANKNGLFINNDYTFHVGFYVLGRICS